MKIFAADFVSLAWEVLLGFEHTEHPVLELVAVVFRRALIGDF